MKKIFILLKDPVTRFNFSCNLQHNSNLERCKISKSTFASQFGNICLTYQTFVSNLHLLTVELRCKLQEQLHCVTAEPEIILRFVQKTFLTKIKFDQNFFLL